MNAVLRALVVATSIVLTGCTDLLGPNGPAVRVELTAPAHIQEPLRFRVEVGGRAVEVSSSDADRFGTATGFLHGPRFGDNLVRVILMREDRSVLASFEARQRFERNHHNAISGYIGTGRFRGVCSGLTTAWPASSLSLAGAEPNDSLFVDRSSLSRRAVC